MCPPRIFTSPSHLSSVDGVFLNLFRREYAPPVSPHVVPFFMGGRSIFEMKGTQKRGTFNACRRDAFDLPAWVSKRKRFETDPLLFTMAAPEDPYR